MNYTGLLCVPTIIIDMDWYTWLVPKVVELNGLLYVGLHTPVILSTPALILVVPGDSVPVLPFHSALTST